MSARLVSIFGPLKGTVFPLIEAEVSIGRDSSNSISIVDPLLSRKHCVIRKEEGHFKIFDLNSRNGIFINDVPASAAVLKHGDEIEMGDSLFLILLSDDQETCLPPKPYESLIGTQTRQVTSENAFYLKPEGLSKARQRTDQAAHDLAVLLKISSVIHSIREVEPLQRKLLELVFEVIPAKRGAILLSPENSDEIVYTSDTGSNHFTIEEVNREIVLRSIRERTAVACEGMSAGRSVLCVPLISSENVIGAVYLETDDSAASFQELHLQLAWGIAAISAPALQNAIERNNLMEQNARLRALDLNMIGESNAFRAVHELITRAAPKDSTVLICGESGTGKELIARAIHRNSPRACMPFVAINCASLSETLLESELFGHEKGAFTGAFAQKKGKLETANGGTVFLDEVSEIQTSIQAKFLRMIQEREFERLGGMRPIKVDIRVVAATNRDLEQAIRTGAFRQDLFYRLNVIRIDVPPLRERPEDIPLLAKYFVSKYSKSLQRRVKGIAPEAMECLLQYDWPGNVRELENLIERAIVLGSTELIVPEDLPEALVENTPQLKTGLMQSVKEAKKKFVTTALQQAGGNYAEAAKILGVHPNYLYRLLRSLGLKRD